ncbi:MAG: protein translocase subunit SecF [Chloroflexi bacterium]|nr:protein translocase subunit SecF [Chloroflexota bacterium]|tara:strand:+ start:205 stop:1125 length:921 start_codon:yes stop_codon:yes gene_type:complete
MIDIVGKRLWFLGISLTLLLVGLIVIAIPPHLNLGIDFTSGSTVTVEFDDDPGSQKIENSLSKIGANNFSVQSMGEGAYFIRLQELKDSGSSSKPKEAFSISRDDLEKSFSNINENFEILSVETVGKKIADGTIQNSIIAVAVASIFVMAYIMYAFRSVGNSFRYAIGAIIALLHDVFIILGLFAILGLLFGIQVNAIFIVGILTVIGYSVNDTIVVFDRIRENQLRLPNRAFSETVNLAINESISRSLNTSATTSLVILAMLLFGGDSLRDFLIVLLLGVIIGTYSSIFVAAQFLVFWEEGFRKK